MVGGTHTSSVSFWQLGGTASTGIESMAEEGSVGPLLVEIGAAITAGPAFSTIQGSGINSPGSAQATFAVRGTFPLVTLVSMVAPSPDWFVGVSGVALYSGGEWLDDVVISLVAYDAGTDSGTDFTSANQDTNPQGVITTFSGPPFAGIPALGTFTFEYIRVLGVCEDLLDNDGDLSIDLEDPGCDSPTDTSELGTTACDDGVDNDLDGKTDFPDDDGCTSPSDSTEYVVEPPGGGSVPTMTNTGLGILALGFAALVAWSTRRKKPHGSEVRP